MRIALLAPHLRNAGGIKILLTYGQLLADKGHDVTVYARSTNFWRSAVANLFGIGKPQWLRYTLRTKRVDDWSDIPFRNYDHLIAGGYKEALALLAGAPQKSWYLVQHDEGLYHGDRQVVDQVLASAMKKIVVSSWLADVVKSHGRAAQLLLLNPYDRTQFYQEPIPRQGGEVTILILDHSFSWKGTAEAIEVVSRLKKKYSQIKLVGFGRRRHDVADLYDRYHFDPSPEELRHVYSAADIFLCMSWDEGFGLPSLEAMACGAAVVTYDNGGSRDFAFDGKTAFVAPRRNLEILAAKLEEAITSHEKRHTIAKAGYSFVHTMPTWEEQVTKMEQILLQDND